MLTRNFLSILLAAITIVAGSATAQERGDPATGLDFAAKACAACHAIRKGDKVSPNALAPAFELIANASGTTSLGLSTHLRSVHENMPAFVLSPGEQDDVIAYILSLKRER